MSDVKSIKNSIAKENLRLSKRVMQENDCSAVKVKSLRVPARGTIELEQTLQDGSDSYRVKVKVVFSPERDRVFLLLWYYINNVKITYKTNQMKEEPIRETEKTLLENLSMDFQDLII